MYKYIITIYYKNGSEIIGPFMHQEPSHKVNSSLRKCFQEKKCYGLSDLSIDFNNDNIVAYTICVKKNIFRNMWDKIKYK